MKKYHSITCASYLLLLEDNKVLLLRRFNTGYEDGNYSVPAGHVDAGEFISDALLREVKEEINVNLKKENVKLAHVMHHKDISQNDERVDFFFTCSSWGGKIKNMEPHKCDDLSWFDINNLPDNIIPYIKKGIENARNEVIYADFV